MGIDKTNVPNIRLLFRQEMLQEEEDMLRGLSWVEPIKIPSRKKEMVLGNYKSYPLLDFSVPDELIKGDSKIMRRHKSLLVEHEYRKKMVVQARPEEQGESSWLDELSSILRSRAPTIAFGIFTGVILMRIS